ncbi:MAG: RNA polymerase sigma factor [Acidimicrobiia bacterium]|nr:RNA polymerase sigma factor [Acidimicrobiia bacterium]
MNKRAQLARRGTTPGFVAATEAPTITRGAVPSHPDIAEWVRLAKAGDPRAYRRIVQATGPWILADCRHMIGSADDAKDLSQEVFTKAFFKLRSLRDVNAFEGWLKRLKVNHCLSARRRSRKHTEVEFDPEWDGADGQGLDEVEAWDPLDLDEEQVRVAVHAALATLGDNLRITLVMHDMDGMSYSEIAEALGIGVSAAKMRIQRARKEFTAAYQERAPQGYGVPNERKY